MSKTVCRYTQEEVVADVKLLCFELEALEKSAVPDKFSVRERVLYKRVVKLSRKLAKGGYFKQRLRSKFLLLISQINLLMIKDERANARFAPLREKLLRERFAHLISSEYKEETVAALSALSPDDAMKATTALEFLTVAGR